MDTRQPTWFKVNNTFKYLNRWYIGTSTGVNLGPYENQKAAALRSKEISNQLENTASPGERIALVRQLIHDEWESSSPGCKPDDYSSQAPARDEDQGKSWFRAERFYCEDGAWFFSTREGIDVGPYDNLQIAQLEAKRLVKILRAAPNPAAAALLISEFNRRPLCAGSILAWRPANNPN